MERGELSRGLRHGGGQETGGEEIDRIPNAILAENTVSHRQARHSHAACQSALDSRRNRMDLQRQDRPIWAGIKGGLAGSVAMAGLIPAEIGWISNGRNARFISCEI